MENFLFDELLKLLKEEVKKAHHLRDCAENVGNRDFVYYHQGYAGGLVKAIEIIKSKKEEVK